MKPTVLNDPRTRRLAALLGGNYLQACGLLEVAWHFAADRAPDGLIGRASYNELAGWALWPGTEDEIPSYLVACGWAVPTGRGVVLVDWSDHMPGHLSSALRQRKVRDVARQEAPSPDLCATGPPEAPHVAQQEAPVEVKKGEGGGGGVGFEQGQTAHTEETFTLGAQRLEAEPKAPKKERTPPLQIDDVTFPAHLDTPDAYTAVVDWLAHRRSIHEPLRSKKYFDQELAKFSTPGDLIAAVASSISSGYQKLVPDRDRQAQQSQTRRTLAANAFDQAEKELGQ